MGRDAARWAVAALVAAACAAGGVVLASVWMPAEPEAPAEPVIVAVTTTATANPEAPAATAAEGPGINLSQYSIDDPASIWVVVNKQRPLDPLDFAPALVSLDMPGGGQLTKEAASAAEQMYAAAKADGAPFRVSTAYRSYNFQKGLFSQYVSKSGVKAAETFSARAGYSEHQTGLAFDLYDPAGCHLLQCYANTPSGEWLVVHAADYGFIERYPEDGADVTGYKWEPWHWRYVGVELAQYMRDQGIATLEEAFGLPPAPSYD